MAALSKSISIDGSLSTRNDGVLIDQLALAGAMPALAAAPSPAAEKPKCVCCEHMEVQDKDSLADVKDRRMTCHIMTIWNIIS